MKTAKKFISVLIAATFILTYAPTAFSSDYEFTYVKDSDHVTITGLSGEFSGDLTIPDTIEGLAVEIIYNDAFAGNLNITGLNLPDNLTTISDRAFENCKNISHINFGSNLLDIGSHSFHGLENLTELHLPDSVKSIGIDCFCGLIKIKEVTLPSSLETLGRGAFRECSELNSVTLNEGLKTLGCGLFQGTKISSVTIPSTVVKMDVFMEYYGALSSNENLKEVIFKDGIKKIPDKALVNCGSVQNVSIPDTTTEIGQNAFLNCEGLTDLNIPDSVEILGSGAFSGCVNLLNQKLPLNLKSIGDECFKGCLGQTSAVMPKNLLTIGTSAYYGCENLSEVTLNKGLTSVGGNAFFGTAIKSATIPKTVTVLGSYTKVNSTVRITSAFNNAKSFTEAAFEPGTEKIPDGSFGYCRAFNKVDIPSSVKEIGECAFFGCGVLSSVTIPDSVTSIGFRAFDNCENLKTIRCVKNSAAYTYAMENNIQVEEIPCAHSNLTTKLEKVPTCTQEGTQVEYCEVCGEIINKNSVPKTNHTIETIPGKDPTCTETGLTEGERCSICGAIIKKQTEIPAKGHVLGEWEVEKPAKVGVPGLKVQKCRVCGETINRQEIPALEEEHIHNFVLTETTATCTKDGVNKYICSICGAFYEEKAPAKGHTPGDWAIVKEPKIGEEGLKQQKCLVCGEVLNEETIPPLKDTHEHIFKATKTVPPTCTEDGFTVHTCSVCGAFYKEALPKTGHTPEIIEGKDPTCTETGLTEGERCSVCGAIIKEQTEIPAKGHVLGKWEIETPAKVGVPGLKTQKCTVCGETINRQEIPAIDPHDFILGDVNSDGAITAGDARLALRISSRLQKPSDHEFSAADMNLDGIVAAEDARTILLMSAEIEE